jgi:hypothetical protein
LEGWKRSHMTLDRQANFEHHHRCPHIRPVLRRIRVLGQAVQAIRRGTPYYNTSLLDRDLTDSALRL